MNESERVPRVEARQRAEKAAEDSLWMRQKIHELEGNWDGEDPDA